MFRPANLSPSDALPWGKPNVHKPLERTSRCSKPAVLFNAARFYQISITLQLSELKHCILTKWTMQTLTLEATLPMKRAGDPRLGSNARRFPLSNLHCRTGKHSIDGAMPASSALCSAQTIIVTITSNICAPQRRHKLRAKEIQRLRIYSTLNLCWNPAAPDPLLQGQWGCICCFH